MSEADKGENEVPRCSFCGTERSPTVPLIAGNEGRICEACVKLAHQVVASWGQRRRHQELAPQLRSPSACKTYLDASVIGQDEAKRTLAVAVYNHYLRLRHVESPPVCTLEEAVEPEKSNILMVGPSGTGKTLLVRSLARLLGVPFVSVDATTLTQAGYVGDDVDSIISRLLEAAGGDVALAQWGIVFIDEVDKLARRGAGGSAVRDISGEGVQQALLKMVEGTEVRVGKPGRRERNERADEQVVDTRNILFVAGGAFPGLEEHVSSRLRPAQGGIGFHHRQEKVEKPSITEMLAALTPDDLQNFGLIPEFIGRFPVITFLHELDHAMLLRILVEPRNSLVKQFRQLFAYQGVGLDITPEALDEIANLALKRGTGARGLRAVMEQALKPTMFELPDHPEVKTCVLEKTETETASGLALAVRQEEGLREEGAVLEPIELLPEPVVPRMVLDA